MYINYNVAMVTIPVGEGWASVTLPQAIEVLDPVFVSYDSSAETFSMKIPFLTSEDPESRSLGRQLGVRFSGFGDPAHKDDDIHLVSYVASEGAFIISPTESYYRVA